MMCGHWIIHPVMIAAVIRVQQRTQSAPSAISSSFTSRVCFVLPEIRIFAVLWTFFDTFAGHERRFRAVLLSWVSIFVCLLIDFMMRPILFLTICGLLTSAFGSELTIIWYILKLILLHSDEPQIRPFSFESDLKAGDKVSVMCSILSGQTPFEFKWLKDGHQLNSRNDLEIAILGEASMLSFKNVKETDSGNYSCRVSNPFGTASHTSLLSIRCE